MDRGLHEINIRLRCLCSVCPRWHVRKYMSTRVPMSRDFEGRHDLRNDFILSGVPYLPIRGNPSVELAAPYHDLPAGAIVGQRMKRIRDVLPELPHAQPGVVGECT